MSNQERRSFRLEWIASSLDPARKIARPTLIALDALLRKARTRGPEPHPIAPDPEGSCAVPLTVMPELSEIGGVACVRPGEAGPVGIARVGRNSFVGYRLDSAGLAEVPVSFDGERGMLVITPGPGDLPAGA